MHEELLQRLVLPPQLIILLRELPLLLDERLELVPDLLGERVLALLLAVPLHLSPLQPEVLLLQALHRGVRLRQPRLGLRQLSAERRRLVRARAQLAPEARLNAARLLRRRRRSVPARRRRLAPAPRILRERVAADAALGRRRAAPPGAPPAPAPAAGFSGTRPERSRRVPPVVPLGGTPVRPAFLSSRRGASLVILPRALGVVGVSGPSRGAIRGGERRERGPEGRSPRSGPLRGAPRAGSFSSSEPRGPPGARRRGDAVRLLRGVLYQLRGVFDAVDDDAAEERGGAADDVHRLHPRRRDEALHGRRGGGPPRGGGGGVAVGRGGGGASRRRRRAGAPGVGRDAREAAADRGHRARDAPIGPFLGSVDRGERRDVEEAGGRVSASRGIGRFFVRLVRRLANERGIASSRWGGSDGTRGGGGGAGTHPHVHRFRMGQMRLCRIHI